MKILIPLLLLTACVAPIDKGVPGHPDPRLKPQLQFTIDGVKCNGACVAQRQSLSKIVFTPPAKTHLLLINTCARQDEFWEPGDKPFTYNFTPAMFVETRGSCPLLITAVTTLGELHRGIIDFSNTGPNNPAKIEVVCNGQLYSRVGFDLCSLASGLPVVVRSATPAVLARDPESDCPDPKGSLREWTIETRKPSVGKGGFCVYVLLNKNKEEFRLSIVPYSTLLGTFPRENNK
jgi:hypothetical protein